VDELETRILAYIDGSGWRIEDITAHVDADALVVAGKLDRLRRLGLLFEEGERLISVVVLPHAPTTEEEGRLAAETAFAGLAAHA